MDAQRAFRGRVTILAIFLFLLAGPNFSASSTLARNSSGNSNDKQPAYLLHASLNETTFEEKIEDYLGAVAQAQSNPAQVPEFIQRID